VAVGGHQRDLEEAVREIRVRRRCEAIEAAVGLVLGQ